MTDIEDRKITDPVVRWVGNGMAAVAVTIFVLYILDYQLGWIDCWAFEWGDFATLVTGAIAAIGAVWIGMRQSKISDRQTEILNHQVEIESISLRAEMYDRRIKIYTDLRTYLVNIWNEEYLNNIDNLQSFFVALEGSRFLFGDEIHNLVNSAALDVLKFRQIARKISDQSHLVTDTDLNNHNAFADIINKKRKKLDELVIPYMRIDEHALKSTP